jgi:hypothetical protein
MKISQPHGIGSLPGPVKSPETRGNGRAFHELLFPSDGGALTKGTQIFERGKVTPPGDLIQYQVSLYRAGLHVEIASRVADGLASTLRKFQGGQ